MMTAEKFNVSLAEIF